MRFLLAFLALAAAQLSLAGTIRIHGSSTVYNSFLKEAKSSLESETGLKLEVLPNGSGEGLTDLAEGKSDMGMISSSLESVAVKLNQKQPGLIQLPEYQTFHLANVEAAFIVNPKNPVKRLTPAQLAGLLSGEIVNWSEVGGPNMPVVVITMIPGDGVRSAVESLFLKKLGKEFAASARAVPSANQAAAIVGQIPTAVGICGSANLSPAIQVVDTEATVVQELLLVTRGEPTADQRRLLAAAEKFARR